jgi:hypothetical protein
MKKMFDSAKDVDDKAEKDKEPVTKEEEKEVADDEWVSVMLSGVCIVS